MEELWSKISGLITADNVALLSVIITVLIFVISRRAEIRYKKHDDKKVQYLKLIDLMQQTLSNPKKDKKGELVLSDETRRLFFDTGASLLLYWQLLTRYPAFCRNSGSNGTMQRSCGRQRKPQRTQRLRRKVRRRKQRTPSRKLSSTSSTIAGRCYW